MDNARDSTCADRALIYFAGSVAGGRQDVPVYAALISRLQQHGRVLTEHLGNPHLSGGGDGDHRIFCRDLRWLWEAHVVVAEVSTPSLGVGYELATAQRLDKPVLCLYRPAACHRLSSMIRGNPHFTIRGYSEIAEADDWIDAFFRARIGTESADATSRRVW